MPATRKPATGSTYVSLSTDASDDDPVALPDRFISFKPLDTGPEGNG